MGSLSSSSSDTQPLRRPPAARSFDHSISRVVLPNPAGAEMRVSFRPDSCSSFSVNRGRETSFGRATGGRSLVDTSESMVSGTWLTSGAHYSSYPCRNDTLCRPGRRSDNRRSAVSERFRAPTLNQAFCWRESTPCQYQLGLSLRTAVRVELAVEVVDVGLYGAHADEKVFGDPAVGFAGGYELENLELPLAEDFGKIGGRPSCARSVP